MPLNHNCRLPLGVVACVALGGAAGSVARWALAEAIGATPGLILVNLLGCVLIGAVYGAIDSSQTSPWWLKPLLGTGFLGGFTTLSTATLVTSALVETAQWVSAIGLLVGLPLACVVGVWLGNLAAHRWVRLMGTTT